MSTNNPQTFNNTFAPLCENKTLSASEIIRCLQFGYAKYETLPQEVKDAVNSIKPRMENAVIFHDTLVSYWQKNRTKR